MNKSETTPCGVLGVCKYKALDSDETMDVEAVKYWIALVDRNTDLVLVENNESPCDEEILFVT